jgi:hypothetical protein
MAQKAVGKEEKFVILLKMTNGGRKTGKSFILIK